MRSVTTANNLACPDLSPLQTIKKIQLSTACKTLFQCEITLSYENKGIEFPTVIVVISFPRDASHSFF